MIAANLPALQIVVPLVAAPVCIVLRGRNVAFVTAVLASWAAFAIAIMLAGQVLASGPISYEIGGWAAPWGIEYRVDALNAFVLLIVSGMGAVVLPFAYGSALLEMVRERDYLFYSMFLL